jgi:hypothetical protein
MQISEKKKQRIRVLLRDEIDSADLDDVHIVPVGYQEYEVESFSINLDGDSIAEEIIRILEEED